MISRLDDNYKRPAIFGGLSTDTKPEGVNNGSVFVEMDTGIIYMYDETGAVWYNLDSSAEAGAMLSMLSEEG